ncbi:hypothetical protein SAMN02927924_01669 [Sphingobium faniae]|nr:hypothetical protein SAMN02927924_01669 [Sphingobium faniae]
MTAASAQAERFARARQEFVEAMQRGCAIPELRKRKAEERIALRQRAHGEVAEHTADLMDGDEALHGDFRDFGASWMMRD